MQGKQKLYLFMTLLAGLVVLWGCPKKAEVTSSPSLQQENVAPAAAPSAEIKTAEAQPTIKSGDVNERSGIAAKGLQPIYFDFNKSLIRQDAMTVMKTNAEWLKANPKAKIKIEGNCDERGTAEYNQALGQRRAANAKKYLAEMGVSGNRISIISYGKEKQVCTEHDETCWQKNRRDDLVVVSD